VADDVGGATPEHADGAESASVVGGELRRPTPPLDWRDRLVAALPLERSIGQWAAAAVAVSVVALAAWWFLRTPPAAAPELVLPMAGEASASPTTSTTTSTAPEVVVHAAGAVASPGLYRLGAGARLHDLLAAAGGAAPDADLDAVNLAAPLADGQRYYVPRLGEQPPTAAVLPGGGVTGDGAAPAPVDLNTATLDELDALPGIGPTTAQAILDHRGREGPFTSVEQLLDVRGIGDAKFEQLRGLVTV
jgi:competence protein ComEA